MIEILIVGSTHESWGYFSTQFISAAPASPMGPASYKADDRIGGVAIVNVPIDKFDGLKFGPNSGYVTITVRSGNLVEEYTSVRLFLHPYHGNQTRIDFTASPDIKKLNA